MIDATTAGWETVHTVHDYYDGPQTGIANYCGIPHAYRCEWDSEAGDWSAVCLLSPITPEQLAAIEEDWSIWLRYRAKFRQGALEPNDKHPALADDWPRHTQLQATVEDALLVNAARAVRAVPEFRGTIEPEYDFEVSWRSSGD
ncbi:hypothetical protein [Novosphingobium sp. 9]|uniref:hypothetical protein n=1 Tax=Novosphingobium sp. 9 TaxID=2025349 RepID=UPI0021B6D6F4|nr:hypothetical protein [Novosphingobium sp. 9]